MSRFSYFDSSILALLLLPKYKQNIFLINHHWFLSSAARTLIRLGLNGAALLRTLDDVPVIPAPFIFGQYTPMSFRSVCRFRNCKTRQCLLIFDVWLPRCHLSLRGRRLKWRWK